MKAARALPLVQHNIETGRFRHGLMRKRDVPTTPCLPAFAARLLVVIEKEKA